MRLNPPARFSRLAPLASRSVVVVLLALAFTLLTGALDGGVGVAPQTLLAQPRFLLANAWPGLLLAAVLLIWTRRALLAFALAFALQGSIYLVNALKVANLGMPLLPADFRMVGQLRRGGFHLLAGYLPHNPWVYVGLGVAVLAIVALWRFEPPLLARHHRGKRVVAGGAMLAMLVSLLVASPGWKHVYNGRVLWMEPWSATATSNHSGLISSLMLFHLQVDGAHAKPDRKAARVLIDEYASTMQGLMQAPPAGKQLPDIIVVQSESFFDPRILHGFQHSDFTPNLNRLAAHATGGKLYVPTFGGGTIRTEFEVLTGLSLRYFEQLQFPYLQLSHKPIPSLVRTLKAHGYDTLAVHGNDPAFWNRRAAFKAIGFDRFVSRSAFPADARKDGKYMADSALTDEVMAQLKDSGPPQFLFAISIEAHGPYDVDPADVAERDAIAVPEGLTGKDKLELQNYLYHLRHADAELGRLVQWLAQRDRPSRVLFYGDHLPALSDVYSELGFVDGEGMLAAPDTWLLLDPHQPQAPSAHADTAAWLLPAVLLDQIGVHEDAYFALAGLVGARLAALTRTPGAAPPLQTTFDQVTDERMRNVSLLRMAGKLASVLPDQLLETSSRIAHGGGEPASHPQGVILPPPG